jgi:D-alanine--poly(phosphoribitol) ligase subunit 2
MSETQTANINRDQVTECVLSAIENLNDQLPEEQHVEKSATAKLFGQDAPLDSLGLVNLIVAVEEQIADDLDLELTLANEKAMSRRTSPFQSADKLIDFIEELIKEEQGE